MTPCEACRYIGTDECNDEDCEVNAMSDASVELVNQLNEAFDL